MAKSQIFGQRYDKGYFAFFGRFEGVCIYLAMAICMALALMLTGEYSESAALLAPMALGFSVLAALRFRLAGAIAAGLVAASVFWLAFPLDWGALPEEGIYFGVGLVVLIYLFAFCSSMVVNFHMRSGEIATNRENLLREALNSLPVGVWVRARSGETVFVNERWADFSDRTVDEIHTSRSTEAPVELCEGWKKEIEGLLESGGDSVRYQPIQLTDSEGNECALNFISLKIRIEHLEDDGTLSLLVDETAVRLREERVKESRNNLSLALKNARMGFWDEDLKGKNAVCDDNWYKLIGMDYDPSNNPIDVWKERLHPDDKSRLHEAYEEYFKKGEGAFKKDYRIRTSEGNYIWVQDRVRITEFALDGSPARSMGTMQDISEQKQIETVLKQAKETAEVANAAKNHFIAIISHEIRTPLNAIIGLSSFLSEGEKDEEKLDLAQTIHASGKSLLYLVNDLLDFSKIEAGHLDLEVQEYPIRLFFEDCVKLFTLKAQEKGLSIKLHLDDSFPEFAIGDIERLRQILQNLLSNALKFTDSGTVEVIARRADLSRLQKDCQPDPAVATGFLDQPDHEYLEVQVHDSGIGIPAEQQHLLFEAFSQIDSSAKRRYEGTGLGLVICKRLVNAMGGRIWVESQSEVGSKFGFVVRTKFIGESPDAKRYTEPPLHAGGKIAHAHPCDIWVVGAADQTDRLLSSCRHLGYSPHYISTYDLSGKGYRRRHYDLLFILVDDSGEALKFLRELRMNKQIQQPRYVVGLDSKACCNASEVVEAGGFNELITVEPGVEVVGKAILKALGSSGCMR